MANVTTLGSQRTVIGQERGGQNTSKRGIENIERGFASFFVRQRSAQRRRLAQEIIPSTFSLVKQLD